VLREAAGTETVYILVLRTARELPFLPAFNRTVANSGLRHRPNRQGSPIGRPRVCIMSIQVAYILGTVSHYCFIVKTRIKIADPIVERGLTLYPGVAEV
jgi:hypothetical protein